MSPTIHERVREQVAAISSVAARHDLHTVVLRDPITLSWLTGARWHVQHTLDRTAFDVVVSEFGAAEPRVQVVASVIEATRLVETELSALAGADIVEVPWTSDRAARLPRGPGVGSDRAGADVVDVGVDIARARRQLTPTHRRALAALTLDSSIRLGEVARAVRPGDRERDVAAEIARTMTAGGMDLLVCLVGADERLRRHKHPLPTDQPMRDRLMLSVATRREGVCTSVTRFVTAGPLSDPDGDRYRAVLAVESAMLASSRPGAPLSVPLAAGIEAYGPAGLDPQEWTLHHQGGFAGFAPREQLATPTATERIEESTVLAWNPSAEGWKVEGVAIVEHDGARLVPEDPSWPVIEVAGRSRPAPVDLSAT